MNVTSTSLAASLAKTPTPIGDPAGADASKPTSGAASAKDAASTFGSSKETRSPGQDVAEKLKDMSKALIALTLIRDPVERAKAAAHLYKQYSQVAKDYAAATADGREAAAQANAQNPAQATDQSADPQAAAAARGAQVAPDGTPADAAPTTDPQAQAATPEAAAAETATPMILTGAKPRFVADLYMEEIKTFAGAAKQMYDTAVQEAKLKKLLDKSRHDGAADEVEDARKDLTEAAKAVEGPDATADVQTPSGASGSTPSASVLNIKA